MHQCYAALRIATKQASFVCFSIYSGDIRTKRHSQSCLVLLSSAYWSWARFLRKLSMSWTLSVCWYVSISTWYRLITKTSQTMMTWESVLSKLSFTKWSRLRSTRYLNNIGLCRTMKQKTSTWSVGYGLFSIALIKTLLQVLAMKLQLMALAPRQTRNRTPWTRRWLKLFRSYAELRLLILVFQSFTISCRKIHS